MAWTARFAGGWMIYSTAGRNASSIAAPTFLVSGNLRTIGRRSGSRIETRVLTWRPPK